MLQTRDSAGESGDYRTRPRRAVLPPGEEMLVAVGIEVLRALVRGQSVAVIGNSQSLLRQSSGGDIDSHDIVVRINRAPVIDPVAQGTKTDVLFVASKQMTADMVRELFDAKLVVWASERRHFMPDYSTFEDRLILYPLELWRPLYDALDDTRPSTGLIALDFFSNHTECKEVSAFGFDFFKSKTFYDRKKIRLPFGREALVKNRIPRIRKLKDKPHSGQREREMVRSLVGQGRVTVYGYRFD